MGQWLIGFMIQNPSPVLRMSMDRLIGTPAGNGECISTRSYFVPRPYRQECRQELILQYQSIEYGYSWWPQVRTFDQGYEYVWRRLERVQ